MPERTGFHPFSGSQHKTQDPVNDEETEPCKNEIEPAQCHMGFIIHLPKTVMIDQQRHDFPDKENPLDGPSEHKGVYQAGSGRRVNQCYDKPDPHAAHSTKHHGK